MLRYICFDDAYLQINSPHYSKTSFQLWTAKSLPIIQRYELLSGNPNLTIIGIISRALLEEISSNLLINVTKIISCLIHHDSMIILVPGSSLLVACVDKLYPSFTGKYLKWSNFESLTSFVYLTTCFFQLYLKLKPYQSFMTLQQ